MNRIHIARNRKSLGQFSPEEVAQGLASGELLLTDLAWREPMDEWKPLSEFTDLPQAVASLTPPALPEASLEPELQLEPAWERRAQLGTLSALVQTVRQVLSVPVATFKQMKREGGIATPLFFYLIVTTLTTWVAMGYQLIVVLMNPEAMLGPLAKAFSSASLFGIQILSMALAPVFMAAVAFCAAGIFHLVFQLLGSNGQPFEVTFRAYCYAVAPASIFRLDSNMRGHSVLCNGPGAADILAARDASSRRRSSDDRRDPSVLTCAAVSCGLGACWPPERSPKASLSDQQGRTRCVLTGAMDGCLS